MERELGLHLRIVSYGGGAEALVALLGGHVQAALLAPPQSRPHVRAGRLRALAWSGTARHPDLPGVPTAAEQGFDRTLSVFKGVMAPPGTPRPIVERVAEAFRRMLDAPAAVEGIRRLGDGVDYLGPDAFAAAWREEYETFRTLGALFRRP
jgi:tripartite-type tricarboxylate transporter receptor subunit TctC